MKVINCIVLLSVLSLASCEKDDENTLCYSFDVRQCHTDLFSSDVPESDTKQLREQKMKNWLEDQSYKIKDISLVISFHEAVCEACHVCPQGDRYFIKIADGDDIPDAEDLQLLNFETADCEEGF